MERLIFRVLQYFVIKKSERLNGRQLCSSHSTTPFLMDGRNEPSTFFLVFLTTKSGH